jgi:RNA polymerase sigma factor (sigma-70 family)
MTDDAELLRRYADEGSEGAFAELVRRNLALVYAAALRHLGDSHRAEEVAQSVFIDLARKARALHRHPALASWLYTSTRYAALKVIRSETRRRLHEEEAHSMQFTTDPSLDWTQLRPLLDEALSGLGERDREIVLLRYFRGLPFADVAARLRLSEGAARMRIDRALDRLNRRLAARGIQSTAAALGVTLAAQPAIAVPAALATTVTSAALNTAAGAGILGTAAMLFAMNKLNFAIGALVFAGLVTAGVEVRANRTLQAALAAPRPNDAVQLAVENRTLHAAVGQLATHDPNLAELNQVRARIALLKARPDGVADIALHAPRNLGRATPANAIDTFCWAVSQRDLELVAGFVRFSDDTPENREAFLGHFSDALRTRYRTPERLSAAAMFGATIIAKGGLPEELESMQVVGIRERHGATEVRIDVWMRSTSGREIAGGDTYTLGPDGWGLKPFSLQDPNVIKVVQDRLDPVTGDFRPPQMSPDARP